MDKIDHAARRLELLRNLHAATRKLQAYDLEAATTRRALQDAQARAYRELAQFDTDTAMRVGMGELASRGDLPDLVRS